MSTFCEVPFEPLGMNGSNYIFWSAHIRNVLRTIGPSFVQAIRTSILPRDLTNLSNKEKECLLCNRRVIDLLFESMDKDFADSIQEEKKFSKIRLDAYSHWQLLEAIYKEDSDDEDQEEDEGLLEEYTTSENHTHPLVASSDDQGRKGAKSTGSLLEPVRPVQPGDSARRAKSAPDGDQGKQELHMSQHLQVMLITSA